MKILITLFLTLILSTPTFAQHGSGKGMMHNSSGWKASLTDSQQEQLAKLKLDYKKDKYLLKAKLKQAKVELAMLITSDKPEQKSIDKKISEIINLKSKKMHSKVKHKIAVRKLLNEDQRVKFDMRILKKAFHGKKHGKRHGK